MSIDIPPYIAPDILQYAATQHITADQAIVQILQAGLERLQPSPAQAVSAEAAAAIAQLDAWLIEEATDDPDAIRAAEEDFAEFKRNMNANRIATGDHAVYP